MMAQRIHRHATHFRIFTAEIVFGYERLHFITQRIIDCSLTGNCRATRSFSTTTSFQNRSPAARRNATQLSRTLALSKRTAQPALQRFQ